MANPGTKLASFSTTQTHLTSEISMLLISIRRGISASFEQGQLVQKEKRLLSRTSAVISSTLSLFVFIRTAPTANPLPTEIWAVLQSESIREIRLEGDIRYEEPYGQLQLYKLYRQQLRLLRLGCRTALGCRSRYSFRLSA